jgi:hypothetical protein
MHHNTVDFLSLTISIGREYPTAKAHWNNQYPDFILRIHTP